MLGIIDSTNKNIIYKKIDLHENDVFLVGRNENSDICIDTPTVSRKHLKIKIIKGEVIIKDLDSANGTFLNGERIKPNIEYVINDEIVVLGDSIKGITVLEKLGCERKNEYINKKRELYKEKNKEEKNYKKEYKKYYISNDNIKDFNLNEEDEIIIEDFLLKRRSYNNSELRVFRNNLKILKER